MPMVFKVCVCATLQPNWRPHISDRANYHSSTHVPANLRSREAKEPPRRISWKVIDWIRNLADSTQSLACLPVSAKGVAYLQVRVRSTSPRAERCALAHFPLLLRSQLPFVFMPRVSEVCGTGRPYTMLGFGDLVIPGVFVSYLRAYDQERRRCAMSEMWATGSAEGRGGKASVVRSPPRADNRHMRPYTALPCPARTPARVRSLGTSASGWPRTWRGCLPRTRRSTS
jgi:hypothetical protein